MSELAPTPDEANTVGAGRYHPARLVALVLAIAWFAGWPVFYTVAAGTMPLGLRPLAGLFMATVLGFILAGLIEVMKPVPVFILALVAGFVVWATERRVESPCD